LNDCDPSITFEESFRYCREILKILGESKEGEPLIDRKVEKQERNESDGNDYFQRKLDKI
jgi:hypothetical protein